MVNVRGLVSLDKKKKKKNPGTNGYLVKYKEVFCTLIYPIKNISLIDIKSLKLEWIFVTILSNLIIKKKFPNMT